jgi:branched-chain amino acid aminotransferase
MIDVLNIHTSQVHTSKVSQCDFENLVFGKTFSDHMFVATYADNTWQDLKIVPYGDISISPALSALHYGQAIFEGLKAYKNDIGEVLIFRPLENWKRLNKSAERLCMPTLPEEVFMSGLTQLLALDKNWIPAKPGYSLYIRPYMFAADEYIGVRPSNSYTFIIFTSPVGAYYSTPVKVRVETHYTRAAAGGMGFAKAAGNYAASMLPAQLAHKEGYDQLLWTDAKEHAYFEESGTMNVMFVINDTLITPPAADTILKGITRDSVLQLARDWDMKVEERRVPVTEVMKALQNGTLQEAFGAGTAATIAHIAVIGYEGKDYTLPPVGERKFSNKVLKTLDDIKTGKAPDPHNWIHKV